VALRHSYLARVAEADSLVEENKGAFRWVDLAAVSCIIKQGNSEVKTEDHEESVEVSIHFIRQINLCVTNVRNTEENTGRDFSFFTCVNCVTENEPGVAISEDCGSPPERP